MEKSKQIVEIRKGQISLNKNSLKDLLGIYINYSISILAIIGPSNTGKSFLMNYLFDYMSKKDKLFIRDIDAPIFNYFPLETSNENETSGIWLSEPIVCEEKENVTILMDSKIDFDKGDEREINAIYGLSTLLSSHLIFNSKEDISETDLQYLNTFIKCMIEGQNTERLQNLIILIRDGEDSSFKSSEEFLQSKQNEMEQINKIFPIGNIRSFMLPSLKEIVETRNFNCSIKSLGDKWVSKLKQLFEKEFNSDKMEDKLIDGNVINCEQFIEYCQSYTSLFNENFPVYGDMLIKTKEKVNINFKIQNFEDNYNEKMMKYLDEKPNVIKSHNNLVNRSDSFIKELKRTSLIMKDLDLSEIERLDNNIIGNFEQISKENENINLRIIQKFVEDNTREFKISFEGEIRIQPSTDNLLEEKMQLNKEQILNRFEQEFKVVALDLKEKENMKLKIALNDIIYDVRKINQNNCINLEAKISQILSNSREYYRQNMDCFITDGNLLDGFKMSEDAIRIKSIQFLVEILHKEGLNIKFQETEKKFMEIMRNDKKEFKIKFQEKNNGVFLNSTVNESLETYKKFINISQIKSIDELFDKDNLFTKIVNQIEGNGLKDNPEISVNLLSSKKGLFDTYKKEFEDAQFNRIFNLKSKEFKIEYLQEMNKMFNKDEILSNDEIQKIHGKKKNEILVKFSENFPSGSNLNEKVIEFIKILEQEEYSIFFTKYEKHVEEVKAKKLTRELISKYQNEITLVSENLNILTEFENAHKNIKEQLIEEFFDKILNFNKINKIELKTKFKNQFVQFYEIHKKKFLEKIRFNNEINELISKIKEEFVKKMIEMFDNDQCYSDTTLGLEKERFVTKNILSFEEKYAEQNCLHKNYSEIKNQLLSQISEIFNNFKIKNQTNMDMKRELIEKELQNIIDQSNIEMDRMLESVKNNEDLENINKIISDKCVNAFLSLNLFNDSLIRDQYLIQLKNNLKDKLIRSKDTIFQFISNKCIESYRNEMQQFFDSDKIFSEDKILKTHNHTEKECLKILKDEFLNEFIAMNQNQYTEILITNLKEELLKFNNFYEVHKEKINIKILKTELFEKSQNEISVALEKLIELSSLEKLHKTDKEKINEEFFDGISMLNMFNQKETRNHFKSQFDHIYEINRNNLIQLKNELNILISNFKEKLKTEIEDQLKIDQYYSEIAIYSSKIDNRNFKSLKEKYLCEASFSEINKNQSSNNSEIFINIGHYHEIFEEIKLIGEGGFGHVYHVKTKSSGESFAIKKLDVEYNNYQQKMSIMREIEIWLHLSNDFVVKFYDHWFESKCVYIKMELCDNNFKNILKNKAATFNRRPSQAFDHLEYFISCEMFKDILQCINYLHQLNPPIIHRDLKPENILICERTPTEIFLKLCDFGLAVFHKKPSQSHTSNVGTYSFLAPEVRNGTKYDCKADVFSTGRIAQELFDIHINLSTKISNLNFSGIKENFLELNKLINKMTVFKTSERPTVSEVLSTTDQWSQNKEDIRKLMEFETTVNTIKEFKKSYTFYDKYFTSKIKNNL